MRAVRSAWSVRTLVVLVGAAAVLAACGDDGGDGGDDAGGDLPAVEGPTSPRVELTATEMAFDPDGVAVDAGNVEVVLDNAGTVQHDVRIEEQPFIVEAGPGQSASDRITLDKGRYRFFCSIPGHRQAGMEGVLEVR
jgi:uncharacterized cupredoxin-like copper-binding protein